LDFSQITQTSQRGVGERSQRLENEYGSLVVSAASKGGRGKLLYLPPPEKLVIENLPVKSETSGFENGTSRI
jgi:hypothetical protein